MRLAGPVVIGIAVIAVFFGGFVTWSAVAPLATAAIAPGNVMVDTSRKTVQHLEGGIVAQILVREGERVDAGEPLIELDRSRSEARLSYLRGQLEADEEQIELLDIEIVEIGDLLERGLARKSRVLELQRHKAEVEGHRNQVLAAIDDTEDLLQRSVIRAGIDGTVVNLAVHTAGGVISPREPLMEIVPRDDPLVIEARIDPLDIDVVHNGQAAKIRMVPFNRRSTMPIDGTVFSISADRMTDEFSGMPYYLARIAVDGDPSEALGGGALYPGMPAEVRILTGERTLLGMLFDPLLRSFRRAFRES